MGYYSSFTLSSDISPCCQSNLDFDLNAPFAVYICNTCQTSFFRCIECHLYKGTSIMGQIQCTVCRFCDSTSCLTCSPRDPTDNRWTKLGHCSECTITNECNADKAANLGCGIPEVD